MPFRVGFVGEGPVPSHIELKTIEQAEPPSAPSPIGLDIVICSQGILFLGSGPIQPLCIFPHHQPQFLLIQIRKNPLLHQ